MADATRVQVGQGAFRFEARDDWEQRPTGYSWLEATAVAVDAEDCVYVFHRGEQPVMVFAPDGRYLQAWGAGLFVRPHGITIGPDGSVYCTDDMDHTVKRFSPRGELLQVLGTSGRPSDTGATSIDFRTILHSGPPFHFPTNVAVGPEGELYVSDGYGNARIHKYAADGRLIRSWGEPGDRPGQFRVPHGIAVDRHGSVWVADRENSRIQCFTANGEFRHEWTGIARPCQLALDSDGNVYVAELGYRAGMWPGTTAPTPDATGGRVSIFNPRGELLARWGGGDNPTETGDFFAPHDIAIDSRGGLYVAEVVMSAGGNRGLVPPTCHSLQKFIRL